MGKKNKRSKRKYYKNQNSLAAKQKSNELPSNKSVVQHVLVQNVVTRIPDKSSEDITLDACNLSENESANGTENCEETTETENQDLPKNDIPVHAEVSVHSLIEDTVSKTTNLTESNTSVNTNQNGLPLLFSSPNNKESKSKCNDKSVRNTSINANDNKGSVGAVESTIVPTNEGKQNIISIKAKAKEDKLSTQPETKVEDFSEYVWSEQEPTSRSNKSFDTSIQTVNNCREDKKDAIGVETEEQPENSSPHTYLTPTISSTENQGDKFQNTEWIESKVERSTDPNSTSIASILNKDASQHLGKSNIVHNNSMSSLDLDIEATKPDKEIQTSMINENNKENIRSEISEPKLKSQVASELTTCVTEALAKSKSDINSKNQNGLEEKLVDSPLEHKEQSVCSTKTIESSLIDKNGISQLNDNLNEGDTMFDKSLVTVVKEFDALKIEQNEEIHDNNSLNNTVEKNPGDFSRPVNNLSVQEISEATYKNLKAPVVNISLLLKDDKSNRNISTSPEKNAQQDEIYTEDNLTKNENRKEICLNQEELNSSPNEANDENISEEKSEHEIKCTEQPTTSTSTDKEQLTETNSEPTIKSLASNLPTNSAFNDDNSEEANLVTETKVPVEDPKKKHRFCVKWFKNLFTRK